MLFENLMPNLPTTILAQTFIVLAILGGIALIYATFVEREQKQDIIRALGAFLTIPYLIYTENTLMTIIQIGIGIAALIEFFEISLGLHRHTKKDLKSYKEEGK
jgi:uncharacterized membrane protein HdeD (DUF308 family)